MRDLSPGPHRRVTANRDDEVVTLADSELPAARYLVGADAIDVLRLPVEATGGVIESARPVHVQYRPGSDVVVRYSAQVSWHGAPAKRETLVAASAVHGRHDGVVPISADTPYGPVEVGVWRWPFDPVVTGLAEIVTSTSVATFLDDDAPTPPEIQIAAYRPTDRAVVRVLRDGEAVAYIKAVAPARASHIADRHEALLSAGVPAPPVRHVDSRRGLVVMEALTGPTLRELIKADASGWPAADEFARLSDALASAQTGDPGPPSRLIDGAPHAHMLAAVLPDGAELLERVSERFIAAGTSPIDGTVHGDLHEGQVIVDEGRIVGLLDVDDVGPGAMVDDWANLIGRVLYRSQTSDGERVERLEAYAQSLWTVGERRYDPSRLRLHTAAALVGLATGPFRIQMDGWQELTRALIERADRFSMRGFSA